MLQESFEIKSYLSEKAEMLNELLNKGDNILLVSPTDSGKTRAIINYARQNPQRRIAILCPTQALVDNLKEDCDLPAGYGKEWSKTTRFCNLIVTTYDSIQFFERNRFDAIFIDEAHYLAQAGIYRVKALEFMMNLYCQKILVTATPNVIERLDGYKRIEFYKYSKPKEISIYNQNDNEINIAHTLIKNRNLNNLLILRINNKDALDTIHERHPDLVVSKIYSDKEQVVIKGQDEEAFKKLKKGMISKTTEVVLATSIIDCGISLEVHRDVDCYAISSNGVINPIDAIQLSARVRSHSEYKMHLNIVGSFDFYSKIELPINSVKGKQQFEIMANEYNMLSKLFIFDYIELLGAYNITVWEKQPMKRLVRIISKKSRSYISIAKNFSSSGNFEEVEDLLKNYNYSHWLDVIAGDENIGFKDDSKHTRVYTDLIEAIECGIPFKFFVKDKYYRDTFKMLKYCVDNYWRENSTDFKAFLGNLISAYRSKDVKTSLPLESYSNLTEQEKNASKQLANLLFKTSKPWKSNSKTFSIKPYDSDVENFVNCLVSDSGKKIKDLMNYKMKTQ